MSVVVLDAWAVLAFLQREGPAAVVVRRLLRRAARRNVRLRMNVVNLGEVYYRLIQTAGAERADIRLQAAASIADRGATSARGSGPQRRENQGRSPDLVRRRVRDCDSQGRARTLGYGRP